MCIRDRYYSGYGLIKKTKPRIGILENVPGILKKRGGGTDTSVVDFIETDETWGLRGSMATATPGWKLLLWMRPCPHSGR